jgi:hypothetical protein
LAQTASRGLNRAAVAAALLLLVVASPGAEAATAAASGEETVAAAMCRVVENAAQSNGLSIALLTRLVWRESHFRARAVSRAGAEGIAQFMPQTAEERGLADPFDPEQAIPKAARLLADLARQFGNIGLAAAAYNAGPARISAWLHGGGQMPRETWLYVVAVTGRNPDDWVALGAGPGAALPDTGQSCAAALADLRAGGDEGATAWAPWGVQLAGNFLREIALASFERNRERYGALARGLQPMIIGTRLRSRGTRPFYRVLLPAASRAEADRLCNAILAVGGACIATRT